MGLQLGEGLLLTIMGVFFLSLTIGLAYREYKESQKIIQEAKQWRKPGD